MGNQNYKHNHKLIKSLVFFLFVFSLFSVCSAARLFAFETSPRIGDREIVERLTRLEEGQKAIIREMDQRFDSIDKRFDSIDKRFAELVSLLIAIVAAFACIVAVTIGFAFWDRMTSLRRAKEEAYNLFDKLHKEDQNLARQNQARLNQMLEAFQKLAQKSPDMREILKSMNLL